MTKLPRDVSGQELIKALRKLGYYPVRQKGSHVILIGPTGKMITVPLHKSLKTGLLRAILREVGISVKVFIELLEDP
ncbi:type II toxin-antitoxin system HicA family toxin [Thermococcus sp.]